MKYLLLTIILLLKISVLSGTECPTDPKDLLINTQDKYDNIYLKYPDCTDFTIVKNNNKFIGDPRLGPYALLLIAMIAGIFLALKMLFKYSNWFDNPIV